MPAAEVQGNPYDGARPRHASCARCGFHFNGVPVADGVIVCPECGFVNAMDPSLLRLVHPLRPPRYRFLKLLLLFSIAWVVILLIIAEVVR